MCLGTILLMVLLLMLIGAFPSWPHSRSWGYGPSSGLGLVLLVDEVVIDLVLLRVAEVPDAARAVTQTLLVMAQRFSSTKQWLMRSVQGSWDAMPEQRLHLGFVRAVDRQQEATDVHVVLGGNLGTGQGRHDAALLVVSRQFVNLALDQTGFLAGRCPGERRAAKQEVKECVVRYGHDGDSG